MDDFEESMMNVEDLINRDPQLLSENLDSMNDFYSRVHFALLDVEAAADGEENWLAEFPSEIVENMEAKQRVRENLDSSEDVQIRSDQHQEYNDSTPYVFHLSHIDAAGEQMVLYSYADLAFLVAIEHTMLIVLVVLVAVNILLALVYYFYMKKHVSQPINAMINVAFDYSRGDFSHQLPVSGRDDLSELAMAMNKMGHSLEINRRAVRQEKELLSHIMNNINTGVLYYGPDKALLLSNPAGNSFLKEYYSEEGKFSDQEEWIALETKIDEAIVSHSMMTFDIELGEEFYNVVILPLIEKEFEDIRGVLVSTQDLTHEHRLDKMRVDFISNISHELRTPLVMVQGYSEAIIDGVAETIEEKKEMATIIRDEAQRMNRMVNEMLDLSRMEAGFVDLHKEVMNLNRYFKTLKSRFSKIAQEQNVTINLKVQDHDLETVLDRDKMDQVFVNLINNAIRHTGMTDKKMKEVTLRAFSDRYLDEIVMEVTDTGTGIPEEDLPYIFDRFFKADKSRKNYSDNKSGTGIGLSLVHTIVEAHDGTLNVESKSGEGTTFIIRLPHTIEETFENEIDGNTYSEKNHEEY